MKSASRSSRRRRGRTRTRKRTRPRRESRRTRRSRRLATSTRWRVEVQGTRRTTSSASARAEKSCSEAKEQKDRRSGSDESTDSFPARTRLALHCEPPLSTACRRQGTPSSGAAADDRLRSSAARRKAIDRRTSAGVAGGGPHGRRRAQTEFDARAARREAHLAARGRGPRRARRGSSDDGDGDDELVVRGKRREGEPDRQPHSAQSLSKRPRGRRERRVTGSGSARPKVRQL